MEPREPLTPRREVQLQGPRPSPLRVAKDSHKIRKPPLPNPAPVIIYSVSPKVIHADERNFMSIVQRLTGNHDGHVSPAARLASIEKTSPSSSSDMMRGFGDGDFMLDRGIGAPGILSPAPASLAAIPAGMFSPVLDHGSLMFMHDMGLMSPSWNAGFFVPTPSHSLLFSPAFASSPTPSLDLFTLFDF